MKKFKQMALALLGSVLFLTGCGSGGSNAGSGDTLIVANGADPVTLDIQATNDQATTRVTRQIFETLINQDDDLNLEPGLATEWEEVEPDLFEFKLREGVTFHNGEEFTADDVEFTLRRALESPQIGHIVGAIDPESIEVVDDHTIRFGTKDTFGPFLTHLAHPALGILNQKAVEGAGEDYGTTVAVGTGPFKFVEWITGSEVIAERYDDYWGEAPEIAKIEFKTITDPSVRLIELESGNVHIAYDIAPSDMPAVKENPDLTLLNTPNLGAEYMGFNLQNDTPLQDVKVRKAISHAIDVQGIIDTVYQGVGEQMTGPINELVFGFNPDLKAYTYDVDLAKKYMADAGYPDGGFKLELLVGDNSQERIQVSQIIAESLSELGIDVTVSQMEWGAFIEATSKGEGDLFLLGWTTVTTDADYGLYPLFHSDNFGAPGNRTFYKNERLDELLDQARYSSDQTQREADYQEAQEIIVDEAPWVFLQTRENVSGIRNNVKGFSHHPIGSYKLQGVTLD